MKKILLPLALIASLSVFADTPKRIVSASGNASEVVSLLGLADNLVAVDTTSLIPADVMNKKPKIGYRRHLSAEGILSMTPDLIILAPDAGPAEVVKQLEASGIPIFHLKDIQTLDGINDDIMRLGKALDAEAAATKLVAQQKAEEESLKKSVQSFPRPPRLIILLDTGGGAFGLGSGTAGEHIAKILGGIQALNFNGMKPLSNEVLATNDADVILMATRNDAHDSSIIKPLLPGKYPALDVHPAMKNGCAFQVNIMRTLGFGPNTAEAAQKIADAILPCIKKDTK